MYVRVRGIVGGSSRCGTKDACVGGSVCEFIRCGEEDICVYMEAFADPSDMGGRCMYVVLSVPSGVGG